MVTSSAPQPVSTDPLIYELDLPELGKYSIVIYEGNGGGKEMYPVTETFPDIWEYDVDLDALTIKASPPLESLIMALTTDPFTAVRIIKTETLNNDEDAWNNLDDETDSFIKTAEKLLKK